MEFLVGDNPRSRSANASSLRRDVTPPLTAQRLDPLLTSTRQVMATIESARPRLAGQTPSAEMPAASAGRPQVVGRIGSWQLVRLLNESELARVYTARPAEASEEAPASYVLKVLRKEWWRDPHSIELQRRAAWVGQRVSHPHIQPVLSAGVEQPPFYLVCPYLAGKSLSELLKHKRRLPAALTLWIARQVAEALDALHTTTHMIHSDVKPSNVIVAGDGHATLIDLGFVHAPSEGLHWSNRPVYGTLSYLAPECLTSRLGASPQSDIYSLGVMLYEMLGGGLPFVGRGAEELIRSHRECQPEPLGRRNGGIPGEVAALVHRMLAKDPLRRPEGAATVVEELVRLEIECFSAR